jgi:hypothetical protein
MVFLRMGRGTESLQEFLEAEKQLGLREDRLKELKQAAPGGLKAGLRFPWVDGDHLKRHDQALRVCELCAPSDVLRALALVGIIVRRYAAAIRGNHIS